MTHRLQPEIIIGAPPEIVWWGLTDLAAWVGVNGLLHGLDARPGNLFALG